MAQFEEEVKEVEESSREEEKEAPPAKEEETPVEEEAKPPASLEDEILSLRRIAREQQRELAILRARAEHAELTQKKQKGSKEDEIFPPSEEEPKAPYIEQLREQLNAVQVEQGRSLEILAATMIEGKYPDLAEVCSRDNVDALIEAIAPGVAKDKSISIEEAKLVAELSIWEMRGNPYKWLYDTIKQHHPAYAAASKKAMKKPVEAPKSIANLGSGSTDKGVGWTKSKIDALSEDELDKIPRDVYEKYMREELD